MIAAALAALAVAAGPVEAALELAPRSVLFGDVVQARATIVVDTRRVDPDTLTVRVAPGVLTKLSERREVERTGAVAVLRVTARLACRSARCVPHAGPLSVALPPAVVGERRHRWPRLLVLPRVPAQALEADAPPWSVDLTPPPPTYRAEPDALFDALVALAGLLGLGGLALLGTEALRVYRRRPRPTRTPLERALARVRSAARADPRERRRAVGALARVLAPANVPLAHTAAQLAWDEAPPPSDDVEALAAQVEREARR